MNETPLFCSADEPAYLGCFRDNLPRDLQVYIPIHPSTIGLCVDTCKSQGFSVGALRNSDLCFCGNAYRKANQVADKECDLPCYDNSFEVCGGFMTFSQYWTGKSINGYLSFIPLSISASRNRPIGERFSWPFQSLKEVEVQNNFQKWKERDEISKVANLPKCDILMIVWKFEKLYGKMKTSYWRQDSSSSTFVCVSPAKQN